MNLRTSHSLLAALCLGAAAAAGQAPLIDSFAPTSGPIGTPVTINGANFSPTPSNNIVYFGAVRATVTSASSNSLTVLAPAGATYQPMTVTIGGFTGTSKRFFLITFRGSLSLRFDSPWGDNTDQPQALSIGDLNGDGRPDLAMLATFSGGFGTSVGGFLLFQNQSTPGTIGPGSLGPAQALNANYPGISDSSARSGVVADIDGDGQLDLVETDWHGDLVVVFRNIGTPGDLSAASFAPAVVLNVPNLLPSSQG